MVELPHEIWLQIVEYLPEHQVQRLYSINRALFNIALDFRHRTVSLGIHPDQVLESTVPSILGNPLLSSRPTSLEVTFYGLKHRLIRKVEPRKSGVPSFLQAVFSGGVGQKPKPQIVLVPGSATKLAQLAIHALPPLTRVTKLSFTYNKALDTTPNVVKDAPLIIPKVLQSIGNRLRSLHIQSLFAGHLPSCSDSPHFGLLESFSLDALGPHHTSDIHAIVVDRIPGFLLAHKSTIRSVSLAVDHKLDNSTLYQALQRTRRLYFLDLSLLHVEEYIHLPSVRYYTACDSDFDYSIISDHRDHFERERDLVVALGRQNLRSLTLRFTSESPDKACVRIFFKDDSASFTFPHVNALTVTLPLHEFVQAPEVVGQFSSSLVSLTLNGKYRKSYSNDLEGFCTMIGGYPCLRDLALPLGHFQEMELCIIGSNLPHLRSLSVTYDDRADWKGKRYVPQLYPDYVVVPWKLESFDFQTCKNAKTIYGQMDDWSIAGQVAIHVPNVGWINNKARQDCLPLGWNIYT